VWLYPPASGVSITDALTCESTQHGMSLEHWIPILQGWNQTPSNEHLFHFQWSASLCWKYLKMTISPLRSTWTLSILCTVTRHIHIWLWWLVTTAYVSVTKPELSVNHFKSFPQVNKNHLIIAQTMYQHDLQRFQHKQPSNSNRIICRFCTCFSDYTNIRNLLEGISRGEKLRIHKSTR